LKRDNPYRGIGYLWLLVLIAVWFLMSMNMNNAPEQTEPCDFEKALSGGAVSEVSIKQNSRRRRPEKYSF
jgi:hypothetical protein